MKILFFIGKGGVGKSTNSAFLAYKLAEAGKKVFLNSLDPAHNLHDLFKINLGQKPKTIFPNLTVAETDLSFWTRKYLKKTEDDFRKIYKYQDAFALHKYFRTLKYSPGLEEYSVLLALEDSISNNKGMDFIIFDTPPTALTIRFLALPSVSLLWLNELLSFRQKILDKKEIITRVKNNKKQEIESDPILSRIEGLIGNYKKVAAQFKNREAAKIFLVMNPDTLSFSESIGIKKELNQLEISIPYVVINKYQQEKNFLDKVENEFPESKVLLLNKQETEITGFKEFKNIKYPMDGLGL